ncbi:MAG TPA: T9SS type A sorting domain-containing protein, partial [bacterium (Candidatus Stahlbacteria)]|nr:T9SS type A sorting domain-containing protein [Candidatus Stahlbacteria bacterium]
RYTSGDSFKASLISKDISSLDTSFIIPRAEPWYLVLTNEERVILTQYLDLSLRLYRYKIGVEEGSAVSLKDIEIMPSPCWGHLRIGPIRKGTKLSIFDLSGRVVREFIADSEEIFWRPVLAAGVYFLKLSFEHEEVVKKIVLIR